MKRGTDGTEVPIIEGSIKSGIDRNDFRILVDCHDSINIAFPSKKSIILPNLF
ncbi:MAG: hypothetical protein P8Y70_02985 [Candidatus Lokiarchaeota archaeon]